MRGICANFGVEPGIPRQLPRVRNHGGLTERQAVNDAPPARTWSADRIWSILQSVLSGWIQQAKNRLSKFLRRRSVCERQFGRDRGLFEVPEDFDAPLPQDVEQAFGG